MSGVCWVLALSWTLSFLSLDGTLVWCPTVQTRKLSLLPWGFCPLHSKWHELQARLSFSLSFFFFFLSLQPLSLLHQLSFNWEPLTGGNSKVT